MVPARSSVCGVGETPGNHDCFIPSPGEDHVGAGAIICDVSSSPFLTWVALSRVSPHTASQERRGTRAKDA